MLVITKLICGWNSGHNLPQFSQLGTQLRDRKLLLADKNSRKLEKNCSRVPTSGNAGAKLERAREIHQKFPKVLSYRLIVTPVDWCFMTENLVWLFDFLKNHYLVRRPKLLKILTVQRECKQAPTKVADYDGNVEDETRSGTKRFLLYQGNSSLPIRFN